MAVSDRERALLADADRCVKCGLCLPHCPTYAEAGHEGDSPRGRIALMQGLASGLIPLTESAERHLDGCVDCRSCESVCPAQVPYGRLLDRGREWLADARPARTIAPRWLGRALAWRWLRWLIAAKLWAWQACGLSALLRRSQTFRRAKLGRLENLLPRLRFPAPLRGSTSAGNGTQAPVQLFTGCMGSWAERDAAVAVTRLLEAAGHPVQIPDNQQCCGALYLHAGLPAEARELFERNRKAFAGDAPIATLATGCSSGLRDLAAGCGDASFASRLRDPLALLATSNLSFAPLTARVAIQLPCTQPFTADGPSPMMALLQRIPGVELVALKSARQCCGAAGSYFLTQPAMADRLLEAMLDAIDRSGAKIVVSANIGCRLHIAGGLRRRDRAIEVLHPAVLLERQLLRT